MARMPVAPGEGPALGQEFPRVTQTPGQKSKKAKIRSFQITCCTTPSGGGGEEGRGRGAIRRRMC
jgi:hypothetical protein